MKESTGRAEPLRALKQNLRKHTLWRLVDRFERHDRTLDADDKYVRLADLENALEALLASEERPDEQPEGHVVLDSSGDRSDVVGENHRLVDRQEQVAPPAVSGERLRDMKQMFATLLGIAESQGRNVCEMLVAVHVLEAWKAGLDALVPPVPHEDQTPYLRPKQHGRDCPKVQHIGEGYLHAAEDDRLYDVDGVSYCGRCHVWMGTTPHLRSAASPQTDPPAAPIQLGSKLDGDEMRPGEDIIDRYFGFEPRS